jgi:pyrroline-5-carboxylate reductase
VLGTGRIGEALLTGLLRAGWPAERLVAAENRKERAEELSQRYGIRFLTTDAAADAADVVVIAVKPQDAGTLVSHIGGSFAPSEAAADRKLLVSVCAGLPTAFFAERLPPGTPVVRVMPNTPAIVAEGMTAISAGDDATAEHLTTVEEMFRPLGRTVVVPESQQDAVTALSGSGPAYFFYLIDAMIEAGVLLGLSRKTATDLIVQTAVGSAVMLRDTGEHPVTLREAVTSPAGTTAAALRELDNHGVRAALLTALEAARNRARELAR